MRAAGRISGGEADALIAALFEAAIPEVEAALRPAARWIAGYSLAGLFAAYAAIATGRFARAASVSGSMWYPGFADWARARLAQRPPSGLERAYFSVGDRERFGRNPSFRSVEDGARRVAGDLARAGAQTKFETRPGGTFAMPQGAWPARWNGSRRRRRAARFEEGKGCACARRTRIGRSPSRA